MHKPCLDPKPISHDLVIRSLRKFSIIGYGNHRLRIFATGVRCVNCGFQGTFDALPGGCAQSVVGTREVVIIEGTFDHYKREQRYQNDTEKRIRYLNARMTAVAGIDVLDQVPNSSTDWSKWKGAAGPFPHWVAKVHPTHRRLQYGGGLAACAKCGAVSSTGVGNSHLWRPCSNKLTEGSKGRLTKVLNGIHPHCESGSGKTRPDGRSADEVIKMKTYVRAIDTPAGESILQPQRFYTYNFMPKEPSERQQLVANL